MSGVKIIRGLERALEHAKAESQDALVEHTAKALAAEEGYDATWWNETYDFMRRKYLVLAETAIQAARPFIENDALERAANCGDHWQDLNVLVLASSLMNRDELLAAQATAAGISEAIRSLKHGDTP